MKIKLFLSLWTGNSRKQQVRLQIFDGIMETKNTEEWSYKAWSFIYLYYKTETK